MVNLNDIQRLIEAGESDTCEWKKSTGQRAPAGKTLCAFLNGNGGVVLIGVRPTGEIDGQEVSDSTRRDLSAVLAQIQPVAPVAVEEIEVSKGKFVIALSANPDPNQRPYLFDGRAYQRTGSSTSPMLIDTLYRQARDRPENENLWEGRRAEGLTLDNLVPPPRLLVVNHMWSLVTVISGKSHQTPAG